MLKNHSTGTYIVRKYSTVTFSDRGKNCFNFSLWKRTNVCFVYKRNDKKNFNLIFEYEPLLL